MYSSQERQRESFRYAYYEMSTAAQGLMANVLHSTKALHRPTYIGDAFSPKPFFLWVKVAPATLRPNNHSVP